MDNKCIVVNLFGVPSAGKSTGAAYIFSKLKMAGVNAELVTEFAKDLDWEENNVALGNQLYVFSNQLHRMYRCSDKVEVLITDSPLPLSIIYNKSAILGEAFNQTVMNCFNAFDNLNYLVLRDRPYNPKGRIQTEEEAEALKKPLSDLLEGRNIEYTTIKGNLQAFNNVVDTVLAKLGIPNKAAAYGGLLDDLYLT